MVVGFDDRLNILGEYLRFSKRDDFSLLSQKINQFLSNNNHHHTQDPEESDDHEEEKDVGIEERVEEVGRLLEKDEEDLIYHPILIWMRDDITPPSSHDQLNSHLPLYIDILYLHPPTTPSNKDQQLVQINLSLFHLFFLFLESLLFPQPTLLLKPNQLHI